MCAEPASVDLDAPAAAEPSARHVRRNYALGVLNGSLGTLAFDFLHPELIIAGMIWALTGSKLLVALVTVVSKAGILAPQLLVGPRLEHRPLKRPYFVALGGLKLAALAAMIAAMTQLSGRGFGVALALFYLAYIVSCVCGGTAYVVLLDITGRMIPPQRVGSFFGMRHFLGGVLSPLLGLLVIQPVLAKAPLPANYLVVMALGALLTAASVTAFALCREEPGARARRRTTLGESLRRGFRWLRSDANYRAFFWQRVAFRINYLSLAFFIPYGSEALGQERGPAGLAALGGILVATMKGSRTLASILWGRVADRHGFRRCMLGAGVMYLVAPSLALLAPRMPRLFALHLPAMTTPLDLPLLIYLVALAAMGAAIQGTVIGGSQFQVTTAPPHRRISYVGFLNTITSPLTLLPLAGAWLAKAVGLGAVFVLAFGGGLISLWSALAMRAGPPGQDPGAAGQADGRRNGRKA